MIEQIKSTCQKLAEARAKLRRRYEEKQKAILAVNKAFDDDLHDLQLNCSQLRCSIVAFVETSRSEFTSPKTREFSGITVGFEKERDRVIPPDESVLVDRIEKMLPAKTAETLLDRSVSIIKNAFKKLPKDVLQKLGCSFVSGADKPVVRANDDDIETLVQKSLGDAATPESK